MLSEIQLGSWNFVPFMFCYIRQSVVSYVKTRDPFSWGNVDYFHISYLHVRDSQKLTFLFFPSGVEGSLRSNLTVVVIQIISKGPKEWKVTLIYHWCYAAKPENLKPPRESPLIQLWSSLILGFLDGLTEAQSHESGEETTSGWKYESFSERWLWRDIKGGEKRRRKKMSQKKEIYVAWRAYNLFSFFYFLSWCLPDGLLLWLCGGSYGHQ